SVHRRPPDPIGDVVVVRRDVPVLLARHDLKDEHPERVGVGLACRPPHVPAIPVTELRSTATVEAMPKSPRRAWGVESSMMLLALMSRCCTVGSCS
ncbi:hypothetical protein U9M48_026370, partial [Paspalum notatum var. saurae]